MMFDQFILSKSRYVRGQQCFKMLYLDINKPKEADPVSTETQKRFKAGRDFEKEYKDKFLGAVNLAIELGSRFNSYPKHTAQLLESCIKIDILEAGFLYDSNLILVDVFQKLENNCYVAHEVKFTRILKDETDQFIISDTINNDNEFQFYVLHKLYGEKLTFNLVLPNPDGEFIVLDRTEILLKTLEKTEAKIKAIRNAVDLINEPFVEMGLQCHKPYACVYQRHCEAIKDNT